MSQHVCPWWLGYFLVNPLRKWFENPRAILGPFVEKNMTVLEPGCGMGFFTLELARLLGPRGKVVAVDIQPRMLEGLRRRARRAGLLDRIEIREARAEGMGTDDLAGKIDFVLAFHVVHEFPDAGRFFAEAHGVLKPGCKLLLAEPQRHVPEADLKATIAAAELAGFRVEDGPSIRSSWASVLVRD
jgi:SAM-dependent methyltransferase